MKSSFLVLGHRGSSLLWPENTLIAFESALRAGADGFELDVMVTADGVPVLFHDPDLRRLHSVPLRVEEATYAQLVELLGSKERVCTLREALQLAEDWSAWVDVEIKTTQWHIVAQELRAFDRRRKIVSSFRHDVISQWKKEEPNRYSFAYIYQHFPKDLSSYLNDVDLVKPELSFLDDRYYVAPHRVLPWAVNNVEFALALEKAGFFGIITDFPGILNEQSQLSTELGYLLSCVDRVEQSMDGLKLVLRNRLAPVYIKEISADVATSVSEILPLMWQLGQTLTIAFSGVPASIIMDTNYTGRVTISFTELVRALQEQVQKHE